MSEFNTELPPEVEKAYMAEKLRELKRDWSDEEPHHVEVSSKSKWRRIWPTIVIGFMDSCKDSGFLSPEIAQKVSQFSNKYTGVEYLYTGVEGLKRYTSQEDIDDINNLIDEVIADLEGTR